MLYSGFALLRFHTMLLYMLPHKMAVPLLLASEQLLSTLHKGTSVVVIEGVLLLIHFQPASQPASSQTFRLLLSLFGWSSRPALLLEMFVCSEMVSYRFLWYS